MTAARLKKGTAQSFILANSERIYVNLSWYDSAVNSCSYIVYIVSVSVVASVEVNKVSVRVSSETSVEENSNVNVSADC